MGVCGLCFLIAQENKEKEELQGKGKSLFFRWTVWKQGGLIEI